MDDITEEAGAVAELPVIEVREGITTPDGDGPLLVDGRPVDLDPGVYRLRLPDDVEMLLTVAAPLVDDPAAYDPADG